MRNLQRCSDGLWRYSGLVHVASLVVMRLHQWGLNDLFFSFPSSLEEGTLLALKLTRNKICVEHVLYWRTSQPEVSTGAAWLFLAYILLKMRREAWDTWLWFADVTRVRVKSVTLINIRIVYSSETTQKQEIWSKQDTNISGRKQSGTQHWWSARIKHWCGNGNLPQTCPLDQGGGGFRP